MNVLGGWVVPVEHLFVEHHCIWQQRRLPLVDFLERDLLDAVHSCLCLPGYQCATSVLLCLASALGPSSWHLHQPSRLHAVAWDVNRDVVPPMRLSARRGLLENLRVQLCRPQRVQIQQPFFAHPPSDPAQSTRNRPDFQKKYPGTLAYSRFGIGLTQGHGSTQTGWGHGPGEAPVAISHFGAIVGSGRPWSAPAGVHGCPCSIWVAGTICICICKTCCNPQSCFAESWTILCSGCFFSNK